MEDAGQGQMRAGRAWRGPTDCTPSRDALGPGAEGPPPVLRRATVRAAAIPERVPVINEGAEGCEAGLGRV